MMNAASVDFLASGRYEKSTTQHKDVACDIRSKGEDAYIGNEVVSLNPPLIRWGNIGKV